MTAMTTVLYTHWKQLRPFLTIRNERDYHAAVKRLNDLLGEVGDQTHHPLYDLLDTLGTLIHAYEEQRHPLPECDGKEMIRYFMEEYSLGQTDIPEIGSQGVVSEILSGKRELNVRQISALAQRFHVSPSVFI